MGDVPGVGGVGQDPRDGVPGPGLAGAVADAPAVQLGRDGPGAEALALRALWLTLGAGIALPGRGSALAGLRGVVDGALADVGEVPRGGREILVVVEHNQVVLGGGGADHQVHGRQCPVRSLP